jgi:hypothetical protein
MNQREGSNLLSEHVLTFSSPGDNAGEVHVSGKNQATWLGNMVRAQLVSFAVQNSALASPHIGSVVEEFNRVGLVPANRAPGSVVWTHKGISKTVVLPPAVALVTGATYNTYCKHTKFTFSDGHGLPTTPVLSTDVASSATNSITSSTISALNAHRFSASIFSLTGSTLTLISPTSPTYTAVSALVGAKVMLNNNTDRIYGITAASSAGGFTTLTLDASPQVTNQQTAYVWFPDAGFHTPASVTGYKLHVFTAHSCDPAFTQTRDVTGLTLADNVVTITYSGADLVIDTGSASYHMYMYKPITTRDAVLAGINGAEDTVLADAQFVRLSSTELVLLDSTMTEYQTYINTGSNKGWLVQPALDVAQNAAHVDAELGVDVGLPFTVAITASQASAKSLLAPSVGSITGLNRPGRVASALVLKPGFYSDYATDIGSQLGSAINRFVFPDACAFTIRLGSAHTITMPAGRYASIEEVAAELVKQLEAAAGVGWRVSVTRTTGTVEYTNGASASSAAPVLDADLDARALFRADGEQWDATKTLTPYLPRAYQVEIRGPPAEFSFPAAASALTTVLGLEVRLYTGTTIAGTVQRDSELRTYAAVSYSGAQKKFGITLTGQKHTATVGTVAGDNGQATSLKKVDITCTARLLASVNDVVAVQNGIKTWYGKVLAKTDAYTMQLCISMPTGVLASSNTPLITVLDGNALTLDVAGYPTASMSPVGVLGMEEGTNLAILGHASSPRPVSFTAPFFLVHLVLQESGVELHSSEQSHHMIIGKDSRRTDSGGLIGARIGGNNYIANFPNVPYTFSMPQHVSRALVRVVYPDGTRVNLTNQTCVGSISYATYKNKSHM